MARATTRWAVAAIGAAAATGIWGAAPTASAATYATTCQFSQASVTLSTAGETQTLSYTVSPDPSWYYYAEFVDSTLEDETPRNDSGDSISLDYDAVISAHGPAPVTVEYRIYELNGTGSSLASSTVLCSATVTYQVDNTDPGDGGGGGTDPTDPGGGGGTDPTDPGDGGGGGTDPTDPGGGGGTDPTDPGDGGGGGTDPTDPGDGGGGGTDPTDPGGGGGTDPTDPGDGGGGGTDPTDPGSGGGTPAPSTPSETGSGSGTRELPAAGSSPTMLLSTAGLLILAGWALRRRVASGGVLPSRLIAVAVVSGGLLSTGNAAVAQSYVSETACSYTPDYAILAPGDSVSISQTGTIGAWTYFSKMLDGVQVGTGGTGQKSSNDAFTMTYDDATGDAQSTTGLFLTFEYYPVDGQGEKIPDSSPLCSFTIGFDHDDNGAADGGTWGDKDGGDASGSSTTTPDSSSVTDADVTRSRTLPATGSGSTGWAVGMGAALVVLGWALRRRLASM